MFSRRLRQNVETVFLLSCMAVVIVLYQNCGKGSSSSSENLSSIGTTKIPLHYININYLKTNLHGTLGEIISFVPQGESVAGKLGDVGKATDPTNTPDGVEDFLTYGATSNYNPATQTTTTTGRALRIRSGKDAEQIHVLNLLDFSCSGSCPFLQVKILDDLNSDGINDILLFISQNSSPNPQPNPQGFSDGVILSGANLAQIKSFRIQSPYPLEFSNFVNTVGDLKKDLVFSARFSQNDFRVHTLYAYNVQEPGATVTAFDVSAFMDLPTSYSVEYDLNGDQKADYSTYDFNQRKIIAYSLNQLSTPIYEKNVATIQTESNALLLKDYDGDGYPEIIGFDYYHLGVSFVMGVEIDIYDLENLNILKQIRAPEGKYYPSVKLVDDINSDGFLDVILVLKDTQDLTRKVEKVIVQDIQTGSLLYDLVPPARENTSYTSSSSGLLLKAQP